MKPEENNPRSEEQHSDIPEDHENIENLETLEDSLPEDYDTAEQADAVSAAEIENLKAENADLKDRLLRAIAETDNIRKRGEKERGDTAKFAVSNFARQLIAVADNLRRALDAVPEEKKAEDDFIKGLMEGVEATEREMLRAFDSAGIKQIDAIDQPFNPNFHEVMFEADMPEKPAGTVIQVLETGYMIHDRLLRPARVGVSKGGEKQSRDTKIDREI